jgi:DNA polymerase III subunit delta'
VIISPNEKNKIIVSDIREASKVLHIQALEAPFKVLIIRDADRMNVQAQNALLKTLEEPPGNVKIILTSSKPRSFLLTILSRCQRLDFRPVPTPAIKTMLLQQMDIDEKTAHLIAALSQGSPARALCADPDDTLAQRDRIADLDEALSQGDQRASATAIVQATQLSAEKDELQTRLQLLGVWLRDQVLIASNAETIAIANIDRKEDLKRLASERGLYQIINRARALELAQHKLSLPFNLNVGLIVEQLCLSLAGQNGSIS